MAGRRSAAGDALTELVLKVFRLNGRFLAIAEQISAGTGLSAARWQVLGAVLPEPLSVAGVARNMGLTRQSVQRLADALVEDGLCEYRVNPAHQRAKFLAPTRAGWAAIARLRPVQANWANRVAKRVGESSLTAANRAADAILAALDEPTGPAQPSARRAASAHGPLKGSGVGHQTASARHGRKRE